MANQALQLKDLEKTLGKVKSADEADELQIIPTNIRGFDWNVSGKGGLPSGRFSTLFAESSAGKSTFALYIAGQLIKQKKLVAWIEAEGTFTWPYARSCGCEPLQEDEDGNIYGLELIDDFTTGEDAYYRLKQRLATNQYDLIVLDSVDKLVPSALMQAHAEQVNRYERQQRASMNAQLVNQLGGYEIKGFDGKFIQGEKEHIRFKEDKGKQEITKQWHRLTDKKTHVIFIQHAADDQSALSPYAKKTYGGDKIIFESTFRLYIKLTGTKMDSNGNLEYKKIHVRPIKNKICAKIPSGATFFLYPDGTVEDAENTFVVDKAVERGVFEKAGAWYRYKGKDEEKYKEKYPDDISASSGDLQFQGKEDTLSFIEKEEMEQYILTGEE